MPISHQQEPPKCIQSSNPTINHQSRPINLLLLPHQIRIHRRNRPFPLQHRLHILHGQPLEPHPRLHRPAPIMARHGHAVIHPRQPRTDPRLMPVHVQPRSREMPALERIRQGILIDEGAPRDIHEAGPAREHCDDFRREEGAAGERGRRGEEEAIRLPQHILGVGVKSGVDGAFLLHGLADDVVVRDLHAEGRVGLLRDAEADVAEADDAEGVGAGVARDGREVVVRVVEAGGGAGARGEEGGGGVPEDGDDVIEGHVADGFGGGGPAVAVEDACPLSLMVSMWGHDEQC